MAKALANAGLTLWASGGTLAALREAGVEAGSVGDLTGFPEVLGGRLKTLHPKVFGGILADPALPGHQEDLDAQGLGLFEVVVVNFYDFAAASGGTAAEAVEGIDIGGPCLVRAAAKNHSRVLVLTDPAQYEGAIAAYEGAGPSAELREECARAAFAKTAAYDGAIAGWLAERAGAPADPLFAGHSPQPLRYGENPHQKGFVYAREDAGLGGLVQHQGKELSYNNLLDLDAAWRLLAGLDGPGATVVKHGNPTGLAAGEDTAALAAAWEGDPRAAFGSVVGVRPALTAAAAEFFLQKFVEVILAPEVEPAALEILARKKNLRVVTAGLEAEAGWSARTLSGVTLWQQSDLARPAPEEWEWHGGRPGPKVVADLRLAMVAAKEMRSNAISLVAGGALVGSGPGSTSRVGALEVALAVAGERARGAVLASDAFFPFRDAIDLAAEAGVAAIVQPGGSIRDEEVAEAAREHAIPMALTGTRHFTH